MENLHSKAYGQNVNPINQIVKCIYMYYKINRVTIFNTNNKSSLQNREKVKINISLKKFNTYRK